MITAHNALSIRRRGSSNSGKNDPVHSLGIPTSTSPAGVDTSLGRCPLRCAVRSGVRSPGSAPIRADSSASINSCSAVATISARRGGQRGVGAGQLIGEFGQGRLQVGHRVEPRCVGASEIRTVAPPIPLKAGRPVPTPLSGTHRAENVGRRFRSADLASILAVLMSR